MHPEEIARVARLTISQSGLKAAWMCLGCGQRPRRQIEEGTGVNNICARGHISFAETYPFGKAHTDLLVVLRNGTFGVDDVARAS